MNTARLLWIGRIFMCLWILFIAPTIVTAVQHGFGPIELGVAFSFLAFGAIWSGTGCAAPGMAASLSASSRTP